MPYNSATPAPCPFNLPNIAKCRYCTQNAGPNVDVAWLWPFTDFLGLIVVS